MTPVFESIKLGKDRPERDSQREKDLIEEVFLYYRQGNFPHRLLSSGEFLTEFTNLSSTPTCLLHQTQTIKQSMLGLCVINHFHESRMIQVPCRDFRTPYEVFMDDDLFKEAIMKRIRYGSNLPPWGIRKSIASMRRTQRVSAFRPTVAHSLYQHYGSESVLDFSMGWGGRMLGALTYGVSYVGIDPEPDTIQGNKEMLATWDNIMPSGSSDVTLVEGCAEDVLPTLTQKFDTILTSPPYFDVERYSDNPSQSYLRYPSLDQWWEGFMEPVMYSAKSLLKPGGCMLLNVNADMEDRTKKVATKLGMTYEFSWGMLLSQHQFNKAGGTFRQEPILVLR